MSLSRIFIKLIQVLHTTLSFIFRKKRFIWINIKHSIQMLKEAIVLYFKYSYVRPVLYDFGATQDIRDL